MTPLESRSAYFQGLNELLKTSGGAVPRLVIDLDALDRNLEQLLALRPAGCLRLVVKSLPSPGLLEYIAKRLWKTGGERRFMVFHLPFLAQVTDRYPNGDILLGKPLPIAAVKRFYDWSKTHDRIENRRIAWLADTRERLVQLAGLAKQQGYRLSVSLEVDIGMHRGGFATEQDLLAALSYLDQNSAQLRMAGFMGYDAHATKAPWPRSKRQACLSSSERLAAFVAIARSGFPALEESPWCINGAGSPTLALHDENTPLNDFSIGSALVKPVGFDVPSLADFEPSAFIATPVLKRLQGVKVPFLEKLPARGRDTLFLYGGRWMAMPVWPASAQENSLYGLSSNQQLITVDKRSGIRVDDYLILRPNQSEAVLLQFGDLLAVRGNRVEAQWPVFPNQMPLDPQAKFG